MASIAQHYGQDHDRLEGLFKQFQQMKGQDRARAGEYFQQFKAGLLRHIAWEEEILFPVFDEKNGFEGVGPTEVMRREHAQIKGWLSEIGGRLLEEAESRSEEEALVGVLRAHNQKEEWILYPAIDGQLSDQEIRDVFSKMEQLKAPCGEPPGSFSSMTSIV